MKNIEIGSQYPENSESSGTPISSPEVQLGLMLASYRKNHGREADLPAFTPTALEEVGDAVFMSAQDEWVDETKDMSLADRFRFYMTESPDERINIRDAQAFNDLLDRVKAWKPKTLH